jgi:nitrate reductase assembly molybdenum cofactor insertion protein NarJ
MYVLLKKRSKYRKSDGKIVRFDTEKYDLPDHLPVGLNFLFFISELKGFKKKAKKSPYLDC